MLVVIAVGVATETFGFKLFGLSFAAGVVATALAFGLVLVALVYAIGPISGATSTRRSRSASSPPAA